MLSIEQAMATRPVVTLGIPTAASQEFGEDVIKRAIEEKRTNESKRLVTAIRRQLMAMLRRLFGTAAPNLEKAVRE